MEAILTISIFIFSYFFLITEKGNRALVACAGGSLMLFAGIIDLDMAFFRYIDWHTIALLFSMMILVSVSSQSGMFEYVAVKAAQIVRGKPISLLIMFSVLTAVGSAFLNNVTTVLLVAPIIFTLTGILGMNAVPFLIAIVMASNIGGTATLIGDPPNLMIGQAVSHLTFNDFLVHLGPPVVLIFIVVMAGLAFYYKGEFQTNQNNMAQKKLMEINAASYIKNKSVLIKSVFVLLLTVTAFIAQPMLQVELTAIAMGGALLLLFLTHEESNVEEVFKQVEWVTIFFFIGLFMLVGGLEESGLIEEMARSLIYYTGGDVPQTSLLILWVSGIVSGFVDNIPFVAAMIPVILEFESYGIGNLEPLWWALALGACLGGNATIIGATANVIVAGLAAKANQGFSYYEFFKVGAPTALVSFLISTIYLYVRYLMFY
ncbi:ArsB/NhaD family transporter [Bacillus sp. FJAT-44742]|uniref:ArsB/NhaD family transporter n=1 Tax=Bacillus sp. FJAT-44742 TaxID=2014005 RepID=UPI000C233C9E|nr:ArsB/NhaD family transporter [Bacillus sp. FJAT-44742]